LLSPETLTVAFVNAASDYLVVLDHNFQLVFANKAFRKIFLDGDETRSEIRGVDFLALVEPATASRAKETLEALDSGPRQVEVFHSAEGKIHPVHYSFGLMDLENGLRFIAGVGRDKTPDLELLGEITQLNLELEAKQRELADAYVRLEQLAVTDQITGLYNRHYFFTVVNHFFEEARRYELALSCFMLDVDHFKSINDHYGHIFGDHVLRTISERLKANTRRSDLLARYGGEEFILVAPNTDLRTAQMLGDRLRAAVEREPFTLGNSTANVTISIGLSGTELIREGPFEHLLDSADQALYVAKRSGRNRCVLFTPAGATAS